MKEAKEVGGLHIPAGSDTTESLELREESLDAPPSLVATQFALVLTTATGTSATALGGDQLDPTLRLKSLLKRRSVPGFIPD